MHFGNRNTPAVRRAACLLALALAAGLVAASGAAAGQPHVRDGVIFGVGIGYGSGRVTLIGGEEVGRVESGWRAGVTPQVRLGYAVVRDRLLVTVANQQWLYEQGVFAADKLRVNAQNWTLALTWCPGNPRGASGGLQIMGGVGLANARLTILEPVENDPHGNKFEEVFKEDERGTAYQLGLGYEFRLGKAVAAGLSASYILQTYDGDLFEETAVYPLNLTLNWYW